MMPRDVNDIVVCLEVAIDSLGLYEYQLFATYFDPHLLKPGELLERTVGREEEARRLWARIGERLMDSVTKRGN